MAKPNMIIGAAALWLLGCNGEEQVKQPTQPLASLIAPSSASKLADKPEFKRLYQLANAQMDQDHVNNTYDLLKPQADNLPAELEYIYRIAQTSLYGRTSTDVLEGVKGLYELAEQGYPYPLLNYSNNEDRGGKERIPYMIPDASMCELPRYREACAQYPVAQVKWQAYVNWARETGDPWAYWNQWDLYANGRDMEAEGLLVLKEGVEQGCRLCAASAADHYYRQLAEQPDSPQQAQWQQQATHYLAIAREGALACEPGLEPFIVGKGPIYVTGISFEHIIGKMSPMNAHEQQAYYQSCLKLGNNTGLGEAAVTFDNTGIGPVRDPLLQAATMYAIYDATVLRRERSDESALAFRVALAMTRFKDSEYAQEADIDQIMDKVLKDKPLIAKVMKQAKEIQKQFPYWGVRNYNNPAMQTINQAFYTLSEMRHAGMRFSFDPPSAQTAKAAK